LQNGAFNDACGDNFYYFENECQNPVGNAPTPTITNSPLPTKTTSKTNADFSFTTTAPSSAPTPFFGDLFISRENCNFLDSVNQFNFKQILESKSNVSFISQINPEQYDFVATNSFDFTSYGGKACPFPAEEVKDEYLEAISKLEKMVERCIPDGLQCSVDWTYKRYQIFVKMTFPTMDTQVLLVEAMKKLLENAKYFGTQDRNVKVLDDFCYPRFCGLWCLTPPSCYKTLRCSSQQRIVYPKTLTLDLDGNIKNIIGVKEDKIVKLGTMSVSISSPKYQVSYNHQDGGDFILCDSTVQLFIGLSSFFCGLFFEVCGLIAGVAELGLSAACAAMDQGSNRIATIDSIEPTTRAPLYGIENRLGYYLKKDKVDSSNVVAVMDDRRVVYSMQVASRKWKETSCNQNDFWFGWQETTRTGM
jgi:hypothetical protein